MEGVWRGYGGGMEGVWRGHGGGKEGERTWQRELQASFRSEQSVPFWHTFTPHNRPVLPGIFILDYSRLSRLWPPDFPAGILPLNVKRRAVRLACPAQRIAGRKKGRRDALPYVDTGPAQGRKARQNVGAFSPVNGAPGDARPR